jgi:histone acetyltransferase MYST1
MLQHQVKNVGEVELGKYRMSTWYFSPLPKDMMKNGYVDVLYVCEFTFNFFVRKEELLRFQAKSDLTRRHPPGNEIYRSGNLSSKQ